MFIRKMSSKNLTCSIPEEMLVFLDEHPDFSPSKLLQSKILEMEEREKFNPALIEAKSLVQSLNKGRITMQRVIEHHSEFLEIKGRELGIDLWKEFTKYSDERGLN